MNYEANTTQWKIGDLVIHDCDAKNGPMLMQVVGYESKTGLCITIYYRERDRSRPKRYKNELRFLHDPNRFEMLEMELKEKHPRIDQ